MKYAVGILRETGEGDKSGEVIVPSRIEIINSASQDMERTINMPLQDDGRAYSPTGIHLHPTWENVLFVATKRGVARIDYGEEEPEIYHMGWKNAAATIRNRLVSSAVSVSGNKLFWIPTYELGNPRHQESFGICGTEIDLDDIKKEGKRKLGPNDEKKKETRTLEDNVLEESTPVGPILSIDDKTIFYSEISREYKEGRIIAVGTNALYSAHKGNPHKPAVYQQPVAIKSDGEHVYTAATDKERDITYIHIFNTSLRETDKVPVETDTSIVTAFNVYRGKFDPNEKTELDHFYTQPQEVTYGILGLNNGDLCVVEINRGKYDLIGRVSILSDEAKEHIGTDLAVKDILVHGSGNAELLIQYDNMTVAMEANGLLGNISVVRGTDMGGISIPCQGYTRNPSENNNVALFDQRITCCEVLR